MCESELIFFRTGSGQKMKVLFTLLARTDRLSFPGPQDPLSSQTLVRREKENRDRDHLEEMRRDLK